MGPMGHLRIRKGLEGLSAVRIDYEVGAGAEQSFDAHPAMDLFVIEASFGADELRDEQPRPESAAGCARM
jgi:hypothetical protein